MSTVGRGKDGETVRRVTGRVMSTLLLRISVYGIGKRGTYYTYDDLVDFIDSPSNHLLTIIIYNNESSVQKEAWGGDSV